MLHVKGNIHTQSILFKRTVWDQHRGNCKGAQHQTVCAGGRAGFVTSGLELWEGKPCARKYFRQRMWGTLTMMQVS